MKRKKSKGEFEHNSEYEDDSINVHQERNWAKELDNMVNLCEEYKRDYIMLRAELRAIKSPRSTTKRNLGE
jgi:hypothetical protein